MVMNYRPPPPEEDVVNVRTRRLEIPVCEHRQLMRDVADIVKGLGNDMDTRVSSTQDMVCSFSRSSGHFDVGRIQHLVLQESRGQAPIALGTRKMTEEAREMTAGEQRWTRIFKEKTKDETRDLWRLCTICENLAVARLLERKGIITRDEYAHEMADVLEGIPYENPTCPTSEEQ